MAGWFDTFAKKSSQRAAEDMSDERARLSRRQIIVGGSAAVATAWTAPVLLASSAAAVGASTCPPPNVICGTNPATSVCCPPTDNCDATVPACRPPGTLGGDCPNNGQGQCNNPIECNSNANGVGCNSCADPNICGGEGAPCTTDADCFGGGTTATCTATNAQRSGRRFCRRRCTSNANCNTAGGQTCDTVNGFCGVPCDDDQDCANGNARCNTNGFCNYSV